MITINSGKLTIPEEEFIIGHLGDNLYSTKQFLVSGVSDSNCTYRLYLVFIDGTANYFVLDSKVENGSTILTWTITEEQIYKSGLVKAQIKSFNSDGEVFHTNTDYFYVCDSAEFSDDFANKENADFLRYERVLNELIEKIENSELSNYVLNTRTIAGCALAQDITPEQMQKALKAYPFRIFASNPTQTDTGKVGQLGGVFKYSSTTKLYTVDMYVCCFADASNGVYKWGLINTTTITDEKIAAALAEYLSEHPLQSGADGRSAYQIAVDNGFEGSEEQWLLSLKGADGEDGVSPTISAAQTDDGYNIVITDEVGVRRISIHNGANGENGADGTSPHIGDNGNWFVADVDTNVCARGEKGDKGDDGKSNIELNSGKKILYLGDSITASKSENGWVYHMNEILSPSLAVNVAVSGARWCDYSNTVYDGNPVFEGDDNNVNNVIGNQVEKILRGKDSTHPAYSADPQYDDFDIIFIACGTNDSEPSGDIETAFYSGDTLVTLDSVDRTTWSGAFRYAVEKLQSLYPLAKLFVCTPIQSVKETHTYAETKAKGDYLKRLCMRMSLSCIDTMQCGICGLFEIKGANGRDLRDGLHTNSNGALKMARYNALCVANNLVPEIVEEVTLTNLVPLSTDTNGSIYNQVGYKNDTRLSSSDTEKDATGYVTTGFIPVESGKTMKSSGSATVTNSSNCYCCAYDENKTLLWFWNAANGIYNCGWTDIVDLSSGNLNWKLGFAQGWNEFSDVAYLRFSMYGSGESLCITLE